MLDSANSSALAEAPRMFHCNFSIVQGHRLGWTTSLNLAEAPRMFYCRLFPHSVGPYARLGE